MRKRERKKLEREKQRTEHMWSQKPVQGFLTKMALLALAIPNTKGEHRKCKGGTPRWQPLNVQSQKFGPNLFPCESMLSL